MRTPNVFMLAAAIAPAALLAQPSPSNELQNLAPQYEFANLDYPGATYGSYPLGINAQREVTGWWIDAEGVTHGYVWKAGKFTSFDAPQAPLVPYGGSGGLGINDHGDVVGVWYDAMGYEHGFLRAIPANCTSEDNGNCKPAYTTIDVPFAAMTDNIEFEFGTGLGTTPVGVNNSRAVVGMFAAGIFSDGFLFSNGRWETVDDPKASHTVANGTKIFAVNDEFAMAGTYMTQANENALQLSHGFLLMNGMYTSIDVPGSEAGGFGTQANAVNDWNEVVGVYSDRNGIFHGMAWIAGRYFNMDAPGAVYSEVHAINLLGDMTGGYSTTDPTGATNTHGFIAYLKP